MKNLIRKILKEESLKSNERQQKMYDYAIKDIIDSIEFVPRFLRWENVYDVMDDNIFADEINGIMTDWRTMDSMGWRSYDEPWALRKRYAHKSNPSRFIDEYGVKEELAKSIMSDLEKEGKVRRVGAGWESIYYDIHVKTSNPSLTINIPLFFHPFRDNYFPYNVDASSFFNPVIKYLNGIYGISVEEGNLLYSKIKDRLVDKFEEESIEINYDSPWTQKFMEIPGTFDGYNLYEGTIDDFIGFTKDKLDLDDNFTVDLVDNDEELETLASYDIEDNKVKVQSKNRALPDIIRSIAHELVHHKQNQDGELTGDEKEGADGSPQENEANAMAGKIVRNYGNINPEIYKTS